MMSLSLVFMMSVSGLHDVSLSLVFMMFLSLLFIMSLSLVFRLSASADEHNTGWKFYFKLYCFLDTENVPKDSVEFAFMFEQVS